MGRPSGAFGGSFCKPSRNATAFAIRTTMPSGEVTIVVCRPSFRNPIRRWQGATARVLTRRGILVCAAACSLFRCGCMAGTNKGITAPVFPSGCGTQATNSTVDFIAVRGLATAAQLGCSKCRATVGSRQSGLSCYVSGFRAPRQPPSGFHFESSHHFKRRGNETAPTNDRESIGIFTWAHLMLTLRAWNRDLVRRLKKPGWSI